MTSREQWSAVDDYLVETAIRPDAASERTRAVTHEAGLPAIEVPAGQGKLMGLIAELAGARSVLEFGTLGGYSTQWFAGAVGPGGTVITLEFEPRHAEVARANLDAAGLGDRVQIRVGAALGTVQELIDSGAGPFDVVFIDADKTNNANYLDAALKLSRPGTVIIGDNVVRGGRVLDASGAGADAEDVAGIRAYLQRQGDDPRLDGTALQTVSGKGWDGFALAIVRDVEPGVAGEE
ncbi:O-methyltransferase [Citricoccus sp. K5]|uniref:O-methyltransferase n=1 Tax=Citricoccus sp. K5 TaxID=2653135 RepID=UPI0012F3224B|nr:O-methyltransferase [Citricoccus sp. K5]VXC06850.1 Putative O-methyltransferase YrrM [Citricoccus sp. K5]